MDALYATILVLVVTNQRIVLAADSRKTFLEVHGVQSVSTIDKIYRTDSFYYAVSGFHEEEGGFSLHPLIHQHLSGAINLHNAIKPLVQTLVTAMKQYFQELKTSHLTLFQQVMRVSAFGGEIFIVGNVNNIPTAYLIDYQIRDDAAIRVVLNTWSIDSNAIKSKESCFWRAIGNTPALASIWLSEKEWAINTVKNAKSLIEEGCRQFPSYVSLPINILELTHDGVHWIEKTPSAPNTLDGNKQGR